MYFCFTDHMKDGPVDYDNYAAFETDYIAAKIHPSELKPAVQAAINSILGMFTFLLAIYKYIVIL